MSISRLRYFLFRILLDWLISNVSATCYYPNGKVGDSNVFVPCKPDEPVSMCCGKGDKQCREDGLCDTSDGSIWRDLCTDSSWESPVCKKVCIDSDLMRNTTVAMTQCTDGSFCCSNDSALNTCCIQGEGFWVVNGSPTNVNPSATSTELSTSSVLPIDSTDSITQRLSSPSTSISVQATVTVTIPATEHATSSVASNPTTQTGSVVGGVVGGVAGICFVALFAWLLIRRGNVSTYEGTNGDESGMKAGKDPVMELDGKGRAAELESN